MGLASLCYGDLGGQASDVVAPLCGGHFRVPAEEEEGEMAWS